MPTETMSQNHEGKRIIYELETAIVNAKKLFLDTQVTKAIVDLMSSVLQVCVCSFIRGLTSSTRVRKYKVLPYVVLINFSIQSL